MIGFIELLFVFGSLLLCSFFFVVWRVKVGRRKQLYEQLATRYGGVVTRNVFFRPTMRFRYGKTQGQLKSKRKRRGVETTVLILDWHDISPSFHVSTPDFPVQATGKMPHHLDASALGFGDPLTLRTNLPDEFKKIMCQSVRWKIEQLAAQFGNRSVSIFLNRGKLTFTKPGAIRNAQQLGDVVRKCLELHDQLLLTLSKGVEFVDEEQATVLDDVKCPICSEEVGERMVICVRCKTPHCRDCWDYNQTCATYACNETRFYEAG